MADVANERGKWLVDCCWQRGIENILLIKDRGEARKLMSSSNPPRNCREAFTVEGDQLYCVPTYRFYSSSVRNSTVLTARVEDDIRWGACLGWHTLMGTDMYLLWSESSAMYLYYYFVYMPLYSFFVSIFFNPSWQTRHKQLSPETEGCLLLECQQSICWGLEC